MPLERRSQEPYFENPHPFYRQGDVFTDVPLAYPMPAVEVALDEEGHRAFLSGPFDAGIAMLTTPTCSMRAQPTGEGYAHSVRTLVPLVPINRLVEHGFLDKAKTGLAQKRDGLINYMYVPEAPQFAIPESLALLYMPVTLHHDLIDDQRIASLTYEAAQQLQKKLVWFDSGILLDRNELEPPED